jgi:hypothetical protein
MMPPLAEATIVETTGNNQTAVIEARSDLWRDMLDYVRCCNIEANE